MNKLNKRWGIYDYQLKGVKPGYIGSSYEKTIDDIGDKIKRLSQGEIDPKTNKEKFQAACFYGYIPIEISVEESMIIEDSNDDILVKGLSINKLREEEAVKEILKYIK